MKPSHRFATIDLLRGVAAMSVCWYHLTNHSFFPDSALRIPRNYVGSV